MFVLTPQAVKDCALRLLARREHSRGELKRKLLQRDFPEHLIEPVLDELSAKGWQDDLRFAQSYTRMRVGRGDGPIKLQMKLRDCGLSAEIVSSVVVAEDAFWQQQLARKYSKKREEIKQSLAVRAKNTRFLQARGFSWEQITKFFKGGFSE